jgi:hypothetical protein
MKIAQIYRIEEGILTGTEIEIIMGFLSIKYPHRKSKDLYILPMKMEGKEVKTWHCCQCDADFEDGMDALVGHLMLHKGRLLKMWNKKQQLKSPIPAVKIPPNEWEDKRNCGTNEDRYFCLNLYIEKLKCWLKKQGIEVI